ncbi:superoxide dismutase family protein [Luteimonas suaedae]|uniref:superoxide dismutase family protein n=1 Tax=Luteimonas suaedae TaxID=2605430 RepID=UPI0011EF3E81|nr:superoxide dismutase family protein [Luteimonas suaedae]
MRNSRVLLLTPALFALAACTPSGDPATEAEIAAETAESEQTATPMPDEPMATATTARATLQPTAGNDTSGELTFTAEDGAIRVSGEVRGLPTGSAHGFHVHETGDCSAPDATSAGGHFNPDDSDHGRVGQGEHHAGDSDNITANDEGVAMIDAQLQGATLGDGAATDIAGKGVIVHADPDDYTSQPTGNAGARLACGVIEVM